MPPKPRRLRRRPGATVREFKTNRSTPASRKSLPPQRTSTSAPPISATTSWARGMEAMETSSPTTPPIAPIFSASRELPSFPHPKLPPTSALSATASMASPSLIRAMPFHTTLPLVSMKNPAPLLESMATTSGCAMPSSTKASPSMPPTPIKPDPIITTTPTCPLCGTYLEIRSTTIRRQTRTPKPSTGTTRPSSVGSATASLSTDPTDIPIPTMPRQRCVA